MNLRSSKVRLISTGCIEDALKKCMINAKEASDGYLHREFSEVPLDGTKAHQMGRLHEETGRLWKQKVEKTITRVCFRLLQKYESTFLMQYL